MIALIEHGAGLGICWEESFGFLQRGMDWMNFFNGKNRVDAGWLAGVAVFWGVFASPVYADDTVTVDVTLSCELMVDAGSDSCELTIGDFSLEAEGGGAEASATWTLEKGAEYELSISPGNYIYAYEAAVVVAEEEEGAIIIVDTSILVNESASGDVSTDLYVPDISLCVSNDAIRNQYGVPLAGVRAGDRPFRNGNLPVVCRGT